jgi:hypothetical protein
MSAKEGTPILTYESVKCCKCEFLTGKRGGGKRLQCNHSICTICLSDMIREKFGNEMHIAQLDKRLLYDLSEKSECAYQTMVLGTDETSGIIECPKCDQKYSILSPIFREFGVPKRIESTIMFKDSDGYDLQYHCCTYADLIHLLPDEKQYELLSNFDYTKEDSLDFGNNSIVKTILSKPDITYHAILNSKSGKIILVNEETCIACNPLHAKDCKHASIFQFRDSINT